MRLASLRKGGRDGTLVVVRQDGERYLQAEGVAATLQAALDEWETARPQLEDLAMQLDAGDEPGEPLDVAELAAPLPRAYEWIDGSAFLNHVILVRKARGAEPPPTLRTVPLVYQGGSGVLLGAQDPVRLDNPEWGLDLEGEVCVVLGDVPQGTPADRALQYVRLVMICNDVTLRNLVPEELKRGFGFFQSKPATAFSPFAVTPDELGEAWKEGRLQGDLRCSLNGEQLGEPSGAEMHFSFADLIAHVAKTRSLTAGTILGSGTVSNEGSERGVSCLAEKRVHEVLEHGEAKTPWLKEGDEVHIEMELDGRSVFGAISQRVVTGPKGLS